MGKYITSDSYISRRHVSLVTYDLYLKKKKHTSAISVHNSQETSMYEKLNEHFHYGYNKSRTNKWELLTLLVCRQFLHPSHWLEMKTERINSTVSLSII